jgi:PAS domain S-box-containing protein
MDLTLTIVPILAPISVFQGDTRLLSSLMPDGSLFPFATLEHWTFYLVPVLVILLGYQQWRVYQYRQSAAKREELFRIVAENAADMIALVDLKGHRLYNSPAYEKVLGYTPEELAKTPVFEQIHPDDRFKVLEAGREARSTGVGKKLEYRIRHKSGAWRILESTASAIKNEHGEVEKLVIVNRDITERKQEEEKVEQDSLRDGQTGLPNRQLFLDRLQRSFARAQRHSEYQYAILFVDVDGFDQFNRTLGIQAGDQIIAEIGRRLAKILRTDDTLARPKGALPIPDALLSRLGGDEFTILLEFIKDPSDAMRVARRVQAALDIPIQVDGHEIKASASVGIALNQPGQESPEILLQEADVAMRRAKALGGARCELFDEALHTRAVNRLQLETELRTAIQQNQFQILYQPIFALRNKNIFGFEALVRWQHPQKALISPYQFIEVAENVGLIVAIGNYVLREACEQIRNWESKHLLQDGSKLTVNLSAKQFSHPELVSNVRAAVQEARIAPSRLQLELTEAASMADPRLTSTVLEQLKHLGVGVSIGDFGAGHSSLNWLRRLPIDELKIDRSLIGSIPSDRCSRDVVQLIITLARNLKLNAVASGIESAVQLNLLEKIGCEFGQGYFFSRPVHPSRAEDMLQEQCART